MIKMFKILGKRGRITIPYEIRQKVGFAYNDLLSFEELPDGKSVVIKREKICDNCYSDHAEKDEKSCIIDYLNGLSGEQQKTALLYLLILWEKKQKGVKNGHQNISN